MAYLFLALLALGGYVWVTPAREPALATIKSATHQIEAVLSSGSAPLLLKLKSSSGYVREKAMELLRKQLHQSVDGLVK